MQEFNERFTRFQDMMLAKDCESSKSKKIGGAWKVMMRDDYFVAKAGGFVPNQPADIDCKFIHACDYDTIPSIIERFYTGCTSVDAFEIDLEQAAREGFTIVYESNSPGGTKYWHLYRPQNEPVKLMSFKCLE